MEPQACRSRPCRGSSAGTSGRCRSTRSARPRRLRVDVRVDLVPRWRGGDLDRLLESRGTRRSTRSVARSFMRRVAGVESWRRRSRSRSTASAGSSTSLPGIPGRRALLVVELKTDVVDVNELLGDAGPEASTGGQDRDGARLGANDVSVWLVIRESRTSRRRVHLHAAMLAGALPDHANEGPAVAARSRSGRWPALTFWTDTPRGDLVGGRIDRSGECAAPSPAIV